MEHNNVKKQRCEKFEFATAWLLRSGFATSSSLKGNFEVTPLIEAARLGCLPVVRYLLEVECPSKRDKRGRSALLAAAVAGHVEVVQTLAAYGHSITAVDKNGSSPVRWAASKGHLDVIKFLFGAGANIQESNKFGSSPVRLTLASSPRHALFLILVVFGQLNNGHTVFHQVSVALLEGHHDVALWLVVHGALNDPETGHISQLRVLHEVTDQVTASYHITALTSALGALLTSHSTFLRVFLPSVMGCQGSHLGESSAPLSTPVGDRWLFSSSLGIPVDHPSRCKSALRPAKSHLTLLAMPEVLKHIADFAGLVTGRQLRNARELWACLSTGSVRVSDSSSRSCASTANGAAESVGQMSSPTWSSPALSPQSRVGLVRKIELEGSPIFDTASSKLRGSGRSLACASPT